MDGRGWAWAKKASALTLAAIKAATGFFCVGRSGRLVGCAGLSREVVEQFVRHQEPRSQAVADDLDFLFDVTQVLDERIV